ncbi:hypothetical protein Pmar_PMAR013996 [Perkinsus marinus ATCC 50983]|uniref:EAL domain-containing protein n=1 Tax=Perkinsus marinus (strain ATCC 50983 / TXsc) TaxID=423536 RepID=C5K943_PERM5|nr:hypothetical protein Pmar_PMAR013996 [Perkinsus marinus ATCC 50983]EER18998.1 hypothetical protein Pmar_PMAR013996 [Perkinsus marinus ATCC 50983]|eukprot:XP_002787202.1 hypothetical protein Pmar_PMAR013996 [Perkinsus marinus ATCC 50983]
MRLTVDILNTYGVSSAGIDILRSLGLVTVSDQASLDTDSLAQQGFNRKDVDTLTRLAVEVGQESINERFEEIQEELRKFYDLGDDDVVSHGYILALL